MWGEIRTPEPLRDEALNLTPLSNSATSAYLFYSLFVRYLNRIKIINIFNIRECIRIVDITGLYAISLKININRHIGDEHNVVE